MTAKQKKKPTVSFIDGIALRTLKPGKLYSARIRMDPDVQFGGAELFGCARTPMRLQRTASSIDRKAAVVDMGGAAT